MVNRRAKPRNLSLYLMMVRLLHEQTQKVQDRLKEKLMRKQYRQVQGKVRTNSAEYTAGDLSAKQLLSRCTHLISKTN
jgi:hypothetical protein